MVKLTVRIREKDMGILRRAARRANISQASYVEEVIEVWLSREREKESKDDKKATINGLGTGAAAGYR